MINIFHKIKNLFLNKEINNVDKKENDEELKAINNNLCDILITLDSEFITGVSLSFKDKDYQPMSENDYSIIYAEFLKRVFTDEVINTILDILNKDIVSSTNFALIKKIDILCKYQQNLNLDNSFIKPSEVFVINHHKDHG